MSSSAPSFTEGKADFSYGGETYQTWYKIAGDLKPGVRPLILLHGGPGLSHHYLLPLADLVSLRGTPVVFYDQVGIGASTHLRHKGADFWTPALFMDELENLLKHLGVAGDYDLLGHSWGGMLGSQFAAERAPKGLRHLVLADSFPAMDLWNKACGVLLQGLPEDVQEAIRTHDEEGKRGDPAYQAAAGMFFQKYVCRTQPMPESIGQCMQSKAEDPTVLHHMLGTADFHMGGTLEKWNIVDKLHNITVPTLVVHGRYDQADETCAAAFFAGIPKVKWYTFAESGHMPHHDERELYMQIVSNFLDM